MSGIGSKVDYQRHVRRCAMVETIEEAFAFCLTGIEEEGIELVVIKVEPTLIWEDGLDEPRVLYDVSVSGPVPARRDEGAED